MKNTINKIIGLITCLVILLYAIIPSISYALEAGKPELKITTSKTTLKRGEEFTATVSLNTNSNKDISSLQIVLNYDKDKFRVKQVKRGINDILTQEEKEGGTESEFYLSNSDTEGRVDVAYTCTKNFEYNGDVFQVVFEVKDNATVGSSDFSIVTDGETYPIQDSVHNTPVYSTVTNASVNIILPLESIKLSSTATELWVGDTAKLSVTYNPADTNQKEITYKSDNKAIADVSQDGTVTAIGAGTAKITATGANNISDTISINVKQPITGITLNKQSLDLERGATEQLKATILPANADGDKKITWETDNERVASVTQDGKVTANAKGSANIKAKTSNNKEATCVVTVGVPLKSISLKEAGTEQSTITEKTLTKNQKFTLEVIFNPEDTDADKTIQWSSTDTSVASVENGEVTAIGGGETTIKATSSNGKTATCTVKVVVPLDSISIKENTSIQYGQTEELKVTYNPIDTTDDKTITWSSDSEDIASVSSNGVDGAIITAKGVGEATITATSSNNKTAQCKVTVLPVKLNSISIKEQNIILNKNDSKNLTVIYNPENTTDDKTVTWKSSNDEIVSVNSNGVIKALKAGEQVTITATVGDKTATTKVDVKVPLESISLDETQKDLNKGDSFKLNVVFNPDDTTDDRTITWSSTDTNVAEVDENGNVTAKKAGAAYIKAKVGDKEASCNINVKVPLTGIEINKETSEILKGQTDKLTVKLNPEDTTYKGTITWKSDDETIVTVDENGNIRGLKEGTATITVTAKEGENEFTKTCEVTVKEIPLDSIEIDISDFDLDIGDTKQLNIICNPENTTDDIKIEWSSSDSDIVSVDENGVVKALKEGTAIITAKVGDKIAKVQVTSKAIQIKEISLEGTETKVLIGSEVDVKVKIYPENATYGLDDLKFISSNSNILYVGEDGKVIARGIGKAILTVEASNGVKSQIEIEVVGSSEELDNATEVKGKETNNKDKTDTNVNDSDSESPKTGDIAIEILIALMVISGLAIAVIVKRKIKQNNNNMK